MEQEDKSLFWETKAWHFQGMDLWSLRGVSLAVCSPRCSTPKLLTPICQCWYLCLRAWHFWAIPGLPPVLTVHILRHAKKGVTHCLGQGETQIIVFEKQQTRFWLVGEQLDPALPSSRPQQLHELNAAACCLVFVRNLTFRFWFFVKSKAQSVQRPALSHWHCPLAQLASMHTTQHGRAFLFSGSKGSPKTLSLKPPGSSPPTDAVSASSKQWQLFWP